MSNPMHSKPQKMFCFLLYYDAPFTQKDRNDDMYTSIKYKFFKSRWLLSHNLYIFCMPFSPHYFIRRRMPS